MIFTQTSDEPYLRHHYRLNYKNKKSIIFDNYQDALMTWFNTEKENLDYIEVIDIKQKSKSRGFK
jgi:hypothetical protein